MNGIFSDLLQRLIIASGSGFTAVTGRVEWLFDKLLIIELTLAGLMWALGSGKITEDALKLMFRFGFLVFLISNYRELSEVIIDSFIMFGLLAGRSGISVDVMKNPSLIIDMGLTAVTPILGWIHKLSLIDFARNFFEVIIAGLCSLIIMFCFFWLAVQVLVAFIEFHVTTVMSFLMLAFAAYKKTAWLSEGAIKSPMMYGVKLGTMAFILSISFPLMESVSIVGEPTFYQMMLVTFSSVIYMMLVLKAGTIAAGIVSGSPSLSATDFTQAAIAASGVAAAGTVAAGAAGGAALKATSAAAKTATSVGAAAKQGAQMASALSTSSSPMGRASDAVGGAIKGAAGYVGNSVSSAASKGGEALKSKFSGAAKEGRLGGYQGTGGTATPGMKKEASPEQDKKPEKPKGSFAHKAASVAATASRLTPSDSGHFQSGKPSL
ncbi:type IV secretion system protein TrbL [Rheinheimera pacifica]|uniref:type IV secretion system protein n=1 Tax=Rheinheimera pacifica TaxID=173990 RepID=UPI002169947D|nr:type IV secretion system protein [Rheinheimera pacifica]MCS4309500.1 type IV secretion system protein TrbL [Rheinheimera pacifica]